VEFQYSIWLSIIPTIVAVLAALYAYRTSRAAQQTLAAARQPLKSTAPLVVTVVDGRARRDLTTDARDYAFLLAVENGTGAETTITDVELRVAYRTRANFCGAVDLALDVDAQATGGQPRLHVPLRLGPGQAASGWIAFHTANIIPRHCRIDGYTLLVTDASGARVVAEASLPAVLRADTDGRGPQTWGWD
jgi:hypothetical protein